MKSARHLIRMCRIPAVAIVAVALVPGAAAAQDAATPNSGRVSLGAGIDFATDYYFRGIIQETDGLITQPYLEAGLALREADSGLQSVSVTVGLWNSLHSAGDSAFAGAPKMWYESDFYASVGFGFADAWSADVTYTAYMSPRGSFGTVRELAVGLGYDDGLLGPYATFAFELDGQADGGSGEGVYLELGVEPGLDLGDSPVAVSFPVVLGVNLNEYYQNRPIPDDPEEDSAFGFFQVGAIFAVPLSGIPAAFGSWDISAGVNFLFFGDGLKNINGSDDDVVAIGVFGISLGY